MPWTCAGPRCLHAHAHTEMAKAKAGHPGQSVNHGFFVREVRSDASEKGVGVL